MEEEGKEIIKAGADAVMRPFSELLLRLFGPSCDQIGNRWGDYWRRWREQRTEDFLCKVEKVTSTNSIILTTVPLKVLHAVFDGASLEDDDFLQRIWANLLANAGDERNINPVSVIFPAILKDLGVREVTFLDALYADAQTMCENSSCYSISQIAFNKEELMRLYCGLGFSRTKSLDRPTFSEEQSPDFKKDQNEFWTMLDIIRRNDVMREVVRLGAEAGELSNLDLVRRFYMTDLGAGFVRACKPPTKAPG